MAQLTPELPLGRRISRLLESFSVDPADEAAFRSLQEHLSASGDFQRLAGVYECRLSVVVSSGPERSALLLSLARVLEEKLEDLSGARRRYEEIVKEGCLEAEVLAALRWLYVRTENLASALQIAEIEEGLDQPGPERVQMLVEVARVWREFGDLKEARRRIREALKLDSNFGPAIEELAELGLAEGKTDEAIRLLERRARGMEGRARANLLERMVDLLGAGEEARTALLLREIVELDPSRITALRRLLPLEEAEKNWERAHELALQLWRGLEKETERAGLAVHAARLHLETSGNLDAAELWAAKALDAAPDDPAVQALRSQLFRKTGQTQPLIQALESLGTSMERRSEVALELATLHEREGNPHRAVEWARVHLESHPTDGEGLCLLERCLEQLGLPRERAQVLERRLALSSEPSDRAGLLLKLAQLKAGSLGDARGAEQAYLAAFEQDPSDPRAAEGLETLLREGRRGPELATKLEELAQRPGPGAARARWWSRLGSVRMELLRDSAGAAEAYRQALDLQPPNVEALDGLFELGRATKDSSLRLEACERRLSVSPDGPKAEAALAEGVDACLTAGDPLRACRLAAHWAELNPGAEALQALARAAQASGDHAEERRALAALEPLLKEDRKAQSECLVRLAELELESPNPEALRLAAMWLEESLSLSSNASVRNKLAEIYRRGGLFPEVVRVLREGLAERPRSEAGLARLELARALEQARDPEEAARVLREAWELAPETPGVPDLLEALLAQLDRLGELVWLLEQRLHRERDPERQVSIATRGAQLLLDELGRPEEAASLLRDHVSPGRKGQAEAIYTRALEADGSSEQLEEWLHRRSREIEGPERLETLLRLASIHEQLGRTEAAATILCRAECEAPRAERAQIRERLLRLIGTCDRPETQAEFLGRLLDEAEDAQPKASLRLERARILAERLERFAEARVELEEAGAEEPLPPWALRLLARIYDDEGRAEDQVRALRELCGAATDPAERRSAALELATILLEGPAQVRNPEAAEELLRRLHDQSREDPEPFHRLAGLLETSGRVDQLLALLEDRLSDPRVTADERRALCLQLARLEAPEEALSRLQTLRHEIGPDPALDCALADILRAAGNPVGESQFARVCAGHASPGSPERQRWLRRWAESLERSGAPSSQLLEQLDALLQEVPHEPALLRKRLDLLRQTGPPQALAEALEEALGRPATFAGPDRGRAVRELISLREGPLRDPAAALDRVERELPTDPSLAPLAARLVTRVGDTETEIRVLRGLVLEPPPGFEPAAEQFRRLGLALFRSGEFDQAEPLLRRAVETRPQDLGVVRALETVARHRGDARERLRWLEARFSLEPRRHHRSRITREGLTLAETLGDAEAALRWIRHWQDLDPLPEALCFRWAELEREAGERPGELRALRAAREQIENPKVRGQLLARQAELLEESGEYELARRARREVVRHDPEADPELLQAWERLLRDPAHAVERAAALLRLAQHPGVPPAERIGWAAERAELLARRPDQREQAALEFKRLLDEEVEAPREQRISWGRALLALYGTLGREAEWCEVAEEVVSLLPNDERSDLARELARKRTGALGARVRTISSWERVLELEPGDEEALRALARLLQTPGHEARRASILEELAETADPEAPALLVEAARARWTVLGDASIALADLDRAVERVPTLLEAHELRQEVCAFLNRPEEEVESLRALLEQDGRSSTAPGRWLRIAQLLAERTDRREESRKAAEWALALASDPVDMRRTVINVLERAADWDRVAELLREEVAEGDPSAAPAALRRLAAVEWRERHDAGRACEVLESLSEREALSVEDRELYADALATSDRWREALSVRAEALAFRGEETPAEAWVELANAQLERLEDPLAARAACEAALRGEPGCVEALRLLADLEARLGNAAAETAHREALAEQILDGTEAARELARAAELTREGEAGAERAGHLFDRALQRDPACAAALLGVGELALGRGEWDYAERCLSRAYSRLEGTPLAHRRGDAARGAARAAVELGKESDVLAHLDVALAEHPGDPEMLDLGATLALRVGAWQKARELLEARLLQGLDDPAAHADRLVQLARAQASLGDRLGSAASLEEAVELRPGDETIRVRLVELLEELGERAGAVVQLDGWIPHAPPEAQAELGLRAAGLELAQGEGARARRRLERIVVEHPTEARAWREVAAAVLEEEGPEPAVARISEALTHVAPMHERAALLALQARALERLDRRGEAALSALQALEYDPGDSDAARCLVAHIGQANDWGRAVRALERTLDVASLAPAVEAELWDAVGRAYGAPLQDLQRAQRAYRRALRANPESDRTRESLADVTSFDPRVHEESLRLHAELLAKFPGRRASWRALERISEHREREGPRRIARWVLAALDGEEESEEATAEARELLRTLQPSEVAEAVRELVRAIEDLEGPFPETDGVPWPSLSPGVRGVLASLAGPAWTLPDEALKAVVARGVVRRKNPDRQIRRRMRAALGEAHPDRVRRVDPEVWRAELMGVAAVRAAADSVLSLREALQTLFRVWPETSGLELQASGDLSEASQLCPPVRLLLLRIADTITRTEKPAPTKRLSRRRAVPARPPVVRQPEASL